VEARARDGIREHGGMTWLEGVTRDIGAHTGIDVDAITVSEEDAQILLDLAGFAAHATGERTNAPLLCHVLGRAVAAGASLGQLDAIVREYKA
jgi:hypothetical protein